MHPHVYVIGAGIMGTDIATAFLSAGFKVTLADSNLQAAQRAEGKIQERLAERFMQETFDIALIDHCRPESGSVVIEAITESLSAKQGLLAQLSASSDATVSMFSNTSTLSITELAEAVAEPQRFAGLHFFFPAHRNPFLEIITARQTSDETVQVAVEIAEKLGKQHVNCRDRPGFVVNAFYLPLVNEAVRLVDEQVGTPSQVDAVAKTVFGVRFGPLAVTKMMSPDTTRLTVAALVEKQACPVMAASIASHEAAAFAVSESDDVLDPAAQDQIGNRLMAAVFFPCLRMLESGDVSPTDIDIAATRALQFSNPPVEMMKQMGQEDVMRVVNAVSSDWGGSIPGSASSL